MSKFTDAFDGLCGNCAGINVGELTDDDVRQQATASGVTDPEQIADAIRGLHEWQATPKHS